MRSIVRGVLLAGLFSPLTLVGVAGAQTRTTHVITATGTVALKVTAGMPVVRLTVSQPVTVATLPSLVTTPHVPTRWVAVGPREIEALALQSGTSVAPYRISVPSRWTCQATCAVTSARVVSTAATLNPTWTAQLLAELGYLPVNFSSSAGPFAVEQVPGAFHFRFPDLPTLNSQWSVGTTTTILTGALMRFQDAHGLPTTGVPDAATWPALLSAVKHHQISSTSYNYVLVSQTQPESLTLYQNGVPTMHAIVNTGISQSPTQIGTYPVYLRYVSQTMRGTNPDGTKYVDPGIPWVSYFYGGDALHGFIRASYGYPQSLGCVEMPFATASQLWPHTPIGTLVTVLP